MMYKNMVGEAVLLDTEAEEEWLATKCPTCFSAIQTAISAAKT